MSGPKTVRLPFDKQRRYTVEQAKAHISYLTEFLSIATIQEYGDLVEFCEALIAQTKQEIEKAGGVVS